MQIARPLTALGYTGDPDCSEKSSTSRLREAEADGVPVTISFHVEDGGEAEVCRILLFLLFVYGLSVLCVKTKDPTTWGTHQDIIETLI